MTPLSLSLCLSLPLFCVDSIPLSADELPHLTNAYIQFRAYSDQTVSTSSSYDLTITAPLSPSSLPSFGCSNSTATNDLSTRPRLQARIPWKGSAGWVADARCVTPDISQLVKEIVSNQQQQQGWSKGDSLVFFIEETNNNNTTSNPRRVHTYDSNPCFAPLLILVVQPPSTATPTAITTSKEDGKYATPNLPSSSFLSINQSINDSFSFVFTIITINIFITKLHVHFQL